MNQMGDSVAPYPVPGYGEPGPAAPAPGFYMGNHPMPNQPVMYQPGPAGPPQQPIQMPAYGGKYQEFVMVIFFALMCDVTKWTVVDKW